MAWRPSPSSSEGVVRGVASQLPQELKSCIPFWLLSGWKPSVLLLICKITIFSYGYEPSLMSLICKITLNSPALCLQSPSQVYGGYPIFLDTPSSGPHYSYTSIPHSLYIVVLFSVRIEVGPH